MKKTNKKEMEKDLKVKEKDLMAKDFETKETGKDMQEKVFTNIKKLECDYTVYKRERINCNMPIEKECAKCGNKFKEGDELYIANRNEKDCIICSKCAN